MTSIAMINNENFLAVEMKTAGDECLSAFERLTFPNAYDTLSLIGLGVDVTSVDYTWTGRRDPVRVAYIQKLPRNRFEFCSNIDENAVRAVIVKSYDTDGLADLVAIDPMMGWTGLYLGNVAIIGQDYLHSTSLGRGYLCHPNGASWLAASRHGIIILDPVKARQDIMTFTGTSQPLLVSNQHHAKEIFDNLAWYPAISVRPAAFSTGRARA